MTPDPVTGIWLAAVPYGRDQTEFRHWIPSPYLRPIEPACMEKNLPVCGSWHMGPQAVAHSLKECPKCRASLEAYVQE